jgi:hypothetical protein
MDIAARAAQTIAGSTIAGEREPGPETTPTLLELVTLQRVAIEFGLPQELSPLTLWKLAFYLAECRVTKRERARRLAAAAQIKIAAELRAVIASGKTKAEAIRWLRRQQPYLKINKGYFEKMCHRAAKRFTT